jgi:hypothetical protein
VSGYMAQHRADPTSANQTVVTFPLPQPPPSPGSSESSSPANSSDWDDGEQPAALCGLDSSASTMASSSISSASSTASVSSDDEVPIPALSTVAGPLLPQPVDPPRIQVLGVGDDCSLRFFAHHSGYAAFARQHKVDQRSRMSLSRRRHPRSKGGHLAARLATAFGAHSDCLTDEHVRIMAEAAGFDYAHFCEHSLFIDILQDDDLRYLEGFEKRYRPFFKGHKQFNFVSAPLVEDLLDSLLSVVESFKANRPFVLADLRFAHAETLVPFLLLLGIHSGDMLGTDAKAFKGLSAMSPFAGNLAIELYAPAPDAPADAFRVRFRLHERYVTSVPALGEDGTTKDGFIALGKVIMFFQNVLEQNKSNSFTGNA